MFEFRLPDVGEGVAEGEIVAWHVEAGEEIDEDAVLAEVETDKAVVDLPSPVAGTVVERHAAVGEVVPVGEVLVTIDTGDGSEPEPGEPAVEVESEAVPDAETGEGDGERPAGRGGRVFAPPNVRRLARELGVEIGAVDGSGPGGRVTEGDVRGAAGKGGSDDETVKSAVAEVDAEETQDAGEDGEGPTRPDTDDLEATIPTVEDDAGDGTETPTADRDRTLAAPATRKVAREAGVDIDAVPTEKTRDGEAFVEVDDVTAYAEGRATTEPGAGEQSEAATGVEPDSTAGEVTRQPYRGVRRTIGEQMVESVSTAPHVTHHDTAVVDALVETRAELQPRAEARGVDLTYLPFVMKAVVAGLREFPILNSTLDEDAEEIVLKHRYDIGVAVATDAGLLVPVVENVDGKGLLDLAEEVADLAERARDRSIAREEMQGGTFSITNFGAIGGEYATPIINYPETAILGLGSIEQRPAVVDGEVVAAHTLPLSLSIDHRVIDGAEAARFVNTLKEYLENPSLLLLE